jgi:DNA-binding GntR family transcriptional regulator
MRARPAARPAPKQGAARDLCTRLRDMIVRSTLAPGAPLIERRLAARLGVSRGSLRTALQRLEHEGFIISSSIGKYSRSIVAPLTIADMEELYTLIAALNGIAAAHAAGFPAERREQLAAELESLNAQLAEASRSTPADFSAVYEIDRRLHARYVEAAGGPRVLSLYDVIVPQSERYGRVYATALIGEISTSVLEHAAIIDAIRAGDPEAADRAAVANWRNAAQRFRRVIKADGERGSY